MSSRTSARRLARRNSSDDNRSKTVVDVDLNLPAQNGFSRRTALRTNSAHVDPQRSGPSAQQQGLSNGLSTSPIDVEEIEDEVEVLSSTTRSPQARTYSRRNHLVVLDEESDNQPQGQGFHEIPSIDKKKKRQRIPTGRAVIDCDALYSANKHQKMKARLPCPEPPKMVLKEPTFTCPICMNELDEASSTICGHIFCQKCIKVALKHQKQCPTCRRKLTASNFHRVYLPARK